MDVLGSSLVMRGVFRAESLLLSFPHRFFGGTGVPRVGACVPTSHSHAAGFHPCVATVHSCGATIHPCVARVHRCVAASHSCVVTVHPCVARVATGVEMVKIDHFGVKTLHFAMNRPV
jgi:hypothetical protein